MCNSINFRSELKFMKSDQINNRKIYKIEKSVNDWNQFFVFYSTIKGIWTSEFFIWKKQVNEPIVSGEKDSLTFKTWEKCRKILYFPFVLAKESRNWFINLHGMLVEDEEKQDRCYSNWLVKFFVCYDKPVSFYFEMFKKKKVHKVKCNMKRKSNEVFVCRLYICVASN